MTLEEKQLSICEVALRIAFLEGALLELMEEARSDIHEALREEFGDDSLLFVSLWNTVEYKLDEEVRESESKLVDS